MYKTAREAASYIEELIPLIEGCLSSVYLAVPYTSISSAAKAAKGSGIVIGAQNMNDARDGAFTGEIAALMLQEAGAELSFWATLRDAIVLGKQIRLLRAKSFARLPMI